ncbi:MAG: carbohydrate-binding domain-containing protein [Clostridia bacterium]|nr:carbohydrate-binding domain-containing protein [Clostridia bacterium]
MRKILMMIIAVVLSVLLLTGCGLLPAQTQETAAATGMALPESVPVGTNDTGKTAEPAETSVPAEPASVSEPDTSVSDRDASGEYDTSDARALSPDGDLTITTAGVYILSGTYENQMITVDAGEEDKVQIVLDNAVITNAEGPAIYVRSADKVFITAKEGTVNTISDGSGYTLTDDDTTLDAAVFSKDDLTINGEGTLTITGNYKHGVVSKDDLVVTAKALTVKAENVALEGKDSVRLSGAAVTVTAGTDGIRSENGTDTDKGYVSVQDSVLVIVSGKDGIQAETVFTAENSEITVTSGGGSSGRGGDDSESYKGIKAGVSVSIHGGTYRVDSLDDGIHTNGNITISEGTFTIQSRDDGIHADETVGITGGTFTISAAEGIEATYVKIEGGDITIQASDDGINAGRKSNAYTPTVEITGGTVTITMGAGDTDGIDSNGNIIITGGTISVNGNSAFDYDGQATFTGGTVIVNGQQVTQLPNQMMGGGKGGMGNMGGFGGFGRHSGRP